MPLVQSGVAKLTTLADVRRQGCLNIVDEYPGTATGGDDTAAINNTIASALSQGLGVYAPSGQYLVSAPIEVGTPGGALAYAGFTLRGDGNASSGSASGTGGTRFVYTGSRFERGVVNVNTPMASGCLFTNFGIGTGSPYFTAKYGLLFDGAFFNGHSVEGVTAGAVDCAFAVDTTTYGGGDGEDLTFLACTGLNTRGFYYVNSGQAFSPTFFNCSCQLFGDGTTAAYTYFTIDCNTTPGGNLTVTGFDGSAINYTGLTSNSTLLSAPGSSGSYIFNGGRVEQCTRLFHSTTGPARAAVTFQGMQIIIDNDLSSATNLIKNFIDVDNFTIVNIRGCKLESQAANTGTTTNNQSVNAGSASFHVSIVFDGTIFDQTNENPLTNIATLFPSSRAIIAKFENSIWFDINDPNTPVYLNN